MGAFLSGTGRKVNIWHAPLLGLAIGSMVMGAALLIATPGISVETRSPCAVNPEPPTSTGPAVARPPRMASVALPPPPPRPSPVQPAVKEVSAPKAPLGPPRIKPDRGRLTKGAAASPARSPAPLAPKARTLRDLPKHSSASSRPLIAAREREVEGRPLLRMLEHGKGPSVEIAWPEHRVARAKLYELLRRCHGLETVLLRGREILMGSEDGKHGSFDTDRHSGCLRAVIGASPRR